MEKNIFIFSDGTGQEGGLVPDELRSNVYKLYRATRCGPDSSIDPSRQLAFYDPGLGSQTDGGRLRFGWVRWLRNVISQATGLGITNNIVDCYAALVGLWRPGDRIYLFGFSRGAYTVRCLAGVLALCGLPTRMKDGSALRVDAGSARRMATEAVRIYRYGSSIVDDPFKELREQRAKEFCKAYGSEGQSSANPYFIGIFDTVAALGASWPVKLKASITALLLYVAVASSVAWYFEFDPRSFAVGAGILLVLGLTIFCLRNLVTFHPTSWRPYFSSWKMRFYDRDLNRSVGYGRHACSIDEARADFERVPWKYVGTPQVRPDGKPPLMRQIWFAGNHSDIGGSYSENESRLSDISLQWMLEQLNELEHPILLNGGALQLYPSATGPQHDECKKGFPGIFGLLGFRWKSQSRPLKPDAPLHPTVLERFGAPAVLNYDVLMPYRPDSLRNHDLVKQYYETSK